VVGPEEEVSANSTPDKISSDINDAAAFALLPTDAEVRSMKVEGFSLVGGEGTPSVRSMTWTLGGSVTPGCVGGGGGGMRAGGGMGCTTMGDRRLESWSVS